MVLAVAVTEAAPEALVTAVKPDSAAPAPAAGAANVTVTPATGLLSASRTFTSKGALKAVLIAADREAAPDTAIDAAGPGVLVSEKFTGVAMPAAEADTL